MGCWSPLAPKSSPYITLESFFVSLNRKRSTVVLGALTESSLLHYLSVFKYSRNLGSSRRGSNEGSLSTQLRDVID